MYLLLIIYASIRGDPCISDCRHRDRLFRVLRLVRNSQRMRVSNLYLNDIFLFNYYTHQALVFACEKPQSHRANTFSPRLEPIRDLEHENDPKQSTI